MAGEFDKILGLDGDNICPITAVAGINIAGACRLWVEPSDIRIIVVRQVSIRIWNVDGIIVFGPIGIFPIP